MSFCVVLLVCAHVAGTSNGTAAQRDPTPPAATCDQACLTGIMDGFIKAMTTGSSASVPLAQDAEVRENTKVVTLDSTAWKQVKAIRSSFAVADALTGNVVSRVGVELADGKPGYISTRLKVAAGGRVTDVEMSADTSPRVVGAYVWNLDTKLTAVLPPEQRMTRVALEALARRYFNGLSTHQPDPADFDDAACNRFHSGQQVTNIARNAVEGGRGMTCSESNTGDRPWGPAGEQRFPVIDVERGLMFGVTLLHYLRNPTSSQMYVSEVFKVIGGKIVKVDNIGLMMQGVTTLGFTH
jgi:hypothetical protein